MDVFVLTTIVEGGENRPVAVTTDEHVANEWIRAGNDNDWIPFTLDDLTTTGLAKKLPTTFNPKPATPDADAVNEINKNLQEANTQLVQVVKQLKQKIDYYARLMGKKTSSNPLLEKQND